MVARTANIRNPLRVSLWPALAISALVAGLPSLAHADQIDGDWCHPGDGRSLVIQGEAIVTPSGTPTTGTYSRHGFRYTAPSGDPDAGNEIQMRQLNDQTMVLSPPAGGEETWKRCDTLTS